MTRSARIVITVALLALTGCMHSARAEPTPSPIPAGTSPRAAILGREPTDDDCFVNAFDLVEIPDAPTLARHVITVARRPAWLPRGGFLGTPVQLAAAVDGQLIPSDPQTTWVLVPGDALPHADRWFPIVTRTGERVWYRDGSVSACA
jgi:hypothetical protein